MKKIKKKPPSRIKYEENHPTVSCRIPIELYDKLQDFKERDEKSFADILKAGLRKLERQVDREDKAYSRGFRIGYSRAVQEFKICYPCDVCGQSIELRSAEAKQSASEYMTKHGWGHVDCHNRRK